MSAVNFGVSPTLIDRVQAFVTARGATIVARGDHAAAAEYPGLTLRPTTLLTFGTRGLERR